MFIQMLRSTIVLRFTSCGIRCTETCACMKTNKNSEKLKHLIRNCINTCFISLQNRSKNSCPPTKSASSLSSLHLGLLHQEADHQSLSIKGTSSAPQQILRHFADTITLLSQLLPFVVGRSLASAMRVSIQPIVSISGVFACRFERVS